MFNAISKHAKGRKAIVFVPSRKQTRLTAIDLLTLAASEGTSNRFLQADPEDIQPFVDKLSDKTLRETLLQGVGYLHEGLSAEDRQVALSLFEADAVQVIFKLFQKKMY